MVGLPEMFIWRKILAVALGLEPDYRVENKMFIIPRGCIVLVMGKRFCLKKINGGSFIFLLPYAFSDGRKITLHSYFANTKSQATGFKM